MKYLLILILVSMVAVLSCSPAPKAELALEQDAVAHTEDTGEYVPGTWIEDWDLAVETAKAKNLTVLVNFTGSDWCSWCMRLASEVFTKSAFETYAKENLVLLKLDFPRKIAQSAERKKQNEALLRQFGVQGFPTILLVNGEGEEIGRTGYREGGAEAYAKHLGEFISASK
jgi:protein disulfide-isomerase